VSSFRFFWITWVLLLAWFQPVAAQSEPFDAPPGANIVGLVWIEDRFWVSDLATNNIYRRADDGSWEVWQTWPNRPGPLAWDGTGLWVVDELAGQIIRVDTEVDSVTRTAVFDIPEIAIREVPSITGLTWDGDTLWLATGCGLCSTFLQIDSSTGDVLQSFFPVCEPRGLAYSHEHPDLPRRLWTVAYNGPNKPALLSSRKITADPGFVSSSQTFSGFGSVSGSVPPEEPTAIAIHEGIWVVDRDNGKISKYDPSAIPP